MKPPTEDEVAEFLRRLENSARQDLMPKMQASAFCLMILKGNPEISLALQIGIALLYDKPLIILALDGVWISPRLRQIADAIVEGKSFDAGMRAQLTKTITDLLRARGMMQ